MMRALFEKPELRHLSLTSLCLYAQRGGKLFWSPRTWSRYAKALGWNRSSPRFYPEKNRVGVRANRPNEIWHIDVTQIKLVTGEKYYIQAVIDNYSRYVLAWPISTEVGGLNTKATLQLALKKAQDLALPPNVYTDGGYENVNAQVDSLIAEGMMTRTIAQFDIRFSNSMIEALFHALKNRHLYKMELRSAEQLKSAVDFYLKSHNEQIPRQALGGATPREIFGGLWDQGESAKLSAKLNEAQALRMAANRATTCSSCI